SPRSQQSPRRRGAAIELSAAHLRTHDLAALRTSLRMVPQTSAECGWLNSRRTDPLSMAALRSRERFSRSLPLPPSVARWCWQWAHRERARLRVGFRVRSEARLQPVRSHPAVARPEPPLSVRPLRVRFSAVLGSLAVLPSGQDVTGAVHRSAAFLDTTYRNVSAR